ncbi:TPA: hypothetical protein QFN59_002013 [Enterococcus faecium]|uniref:hypothetical protein n=1 Tax=Enterococcus sp. TaxID=35783 RepID=UPI002844A760|nr:hypothetical protein [Enterococcus sp.]MDR3761360.1 hypothetical protein [Enterococcus sp.]
MSQGKKDNLEGQTFGKYKIIGDTPNRSNRGDRKVLARHENGELSELNVHELLNGKTTGYRKNKEKGKKLGEINKKKYVNADGIHLPSINAKKRSDNKSGVRGVFYDKRRKKYRATLKVNKVLVLNEGFEELNDAILARKNAENKYLTKARKEYKKMKGESK